MDTIQVIMYYDDYEKYFGDGFYPLVQREKKENTQIKISFKYINDYWIQITQDEITGLDDNNGSKLLEILNREGNKEGKVIKNSYGLNIHKNNIIHDL